MPWPSPLCFLAVLTEQLCSPWSFICEGLLCVAQKQWSQRWWVEISDAVSQSNTPPKKKNCIYQVFLMVMENPTAQITTDLHSGWNCSLIVLGAGLAI